MNASPDQVTAPPRPAIPAAERLVNLTPHDVVLNATELPRPGQDPEEATSATCRLAPQGTSARVDDASGTLSQDWLNSGTSLIRLTRLRRSARLTGLPPPTAGTRFVVSRLTALAAGHRDDLAFPYGEERDEAGQITSVRGLAAFRPRWAPGQRYRDWRTARRAGLARQEPGRDWLTGVLFVTATALLSGFLALVPGAIDNGVRHGWAGGGLAWTSWSGIFFLLAGGSLLVAGAVRWRRRTQVLTGRGTAYVIDEVAIPWQHEEKESVFADIRAGFARTLLVPGPGALGDSWQWQTTAEAAARWDDNVDRLVRSFWAVHYNDDQVTSNALFTWAPWPVAMAFSARATARRRGLVLHVRQRPSYGATGPQTRLLLTDPAHDYLRTTRPAPLEVTAPRHSVAHLHAELTLTIDSLIAPHSAQTQHPIRQKAPARTPGAAGRAGPVLLLLIRTTHDAIGPIPLDLATATPVTVHSACPALPTGTRKVQAAEWRLDSPVSPVPQLPWPAFPAAAESIADWITEKSAEHPDHIVLIAARLPQELAVGLGIQLGQLRRDWPRHAYPLHYAHGRLVIPDLSLGADSVPAERT
jgi:hypothetical protein